MRRTALLFEHGHPDKPPGHAITPVIFLLVLLSSISGLSARGKADLLVSGGTIGGAEALNLSRDIGSLEKGRKADFILVETESPLIRPLFDIYSQLVYSAKGSDVGTSVINGKVEMPDGRVMTLNGGRFLRKRRNTGVRIGGKNDNLPPFCRG